MRCSGTLSLHLIFNSPYVIQQHSVASLMTSLKFISKQKYISVYKRAKENIFP